MREILDYVLRALGLNRKDRLEGETGDRLPRLEPLEHTHAVGVHNHDHDHPHKHPDDALDHDHGSHVVAVHDHAPIAHDHERYASIEHNHNVSVWTMPRLDVLLVVVVRVEDERGINVLAGVQAAANESVRFWREDAGIDVRFTVHGEKMLIDDPSYDRLFELFSTASRWNVRGPLPVIFMIPHLDRLAGKNWLGLAWEPFGFAVIAGENTSVTNETLDHELGHLMNVDHEEGTFMRPTIEEHGNVVTEEQKIKLHESEYLR